MITIDEKAKNDLKVRCYSSNIMPSLSNFEQLILLLLHCYLLKILFLIILHTCNSVWCVAFNTKLDLRKRNKASVVWMPVYERFHASMAWYLFLMVATHIYGWVLAGCGWVWLGVGGFLGGCGWVYVAGCEWILAGCGGCGCVLGGCGYVWMGVDGSLF